MIIFRTISPYTAGLSFPNGTIPQDTDLNSLAANANNLQSGGRPCMAVTSLNGGYMYNPALSPKQWYAVDIAPGFTHLDIHIRLQLRGQSSSEIVSLDLLKNGATQHVGDIISSPYLNAVVPPNPYVIPRPGTLTAIADLYISLKLNRSIRALTGDVERAYLGIEHDFSVIPFGAYGPDDSGVYGVWAYGYKLCSR